MNYLRMIKLDVSIPNGMEFYIKYLIVIPVICRVSIPNGMEFYIENMEVAFIWKKFQFPTGWNSTLQKGTS